MERLNRRQLVGCVPIALLGIPSMARAAQVVPFNLRIFIPSPAVTYATRTFNGGQKALLAGTVDLGTSGAASLSVSQRQFGTTREYADGVATDVAGKPSWYKNLPANAAPIATATAEVNNDTLRASWLVPSGATHGIELWVVGKNPLVALAPAIDSVMKIGLRITGGVVQYSLNAEHDAFPSYELKLGTRTLVNYDCVASGGTPFDLDPGMEESVTVPWSAL